MVNQDSPSPETFKISIFPLTSFPASGRCCPDSEDGGCCDDGTCVKETDTCCLSGGACGRGKDCCMDGCKPRSNTCCDDGGSCQPGHYCCGNGTCSPKGGECCVDRSVCDAGLVCVVLNGVLSCCKNLSCSEFQEGGPGGDGGSENRYFAPTGPQPVGCAWATGLTGAAMVLRAGMILL